MQIHDLIVALNCNRILGRLGSTLFQAPTHLNKPREPLPIRLRGLFRANTQSAPGRRSPDLARLDSQICGFERAFQRLDTGNSGDIAHNVSLIIKQASYLTEDGVKFPDRLRALGWATSHLDARAIREMGKVANYWRISRHLTICSQRFRSHFANATWLSVPSYRRSTTSKVQPQQFIHAESSFWSFTS